MFPGRCSHLRGLVTFPAGDLDPSGRPQHAPRAGDRVRPAKLALAASLLSIAAGDAVAGPCPGPRCSDMAGPARSRPSVDRRSPRHVARTEAEREHRLVTDAIARARLGRKARTSWPVPPGCGSRSRRSCWRTRCSESRIWHPDLFRQPSRPLPPESRDSRNLGTAGISGIDKRRGAGL
jgi:hypothetical protein